MAAPTEFLHPLPRDVRDVAPPERFTFPFYYRPHRLARAAAADLQQHLLGPRDWSHDFGLDDPGTGGRGKMFGVLVVRDTSGGLNYLAAFSGKLADSNHLPGFVPPVFDLLDEANFYREGEREVNRVTERIEALRSDPDFLHAQEDFQRTEEEGNRQLAEERASIKQAKADRRRRREEAATTLAPSELSTLEQELAAESIRRSYGLKDLTKAVKYQLKLKKKKLDEYNSALEELIDLRKRMSADLQQRIFAAYTFLDAGGKERELGSIFSETVFGVPPAGAGECAAPKLLQFAYLHDLEPVALAEFWWGEAPDSEIRQHLQYYPACRGKCEPILSHMLRGLEVDPNPLLVNPARDKHLSFVYEDEQLLVVDKPAEFLSVPGRHIADSVHHRIRERFPEATGPLIVHRLDMSTSGLLLITKSAEVHKRIQRQFFRRTVEKRYVALVEGSVVGEEGYIDLPLRGDLDDRPRQIVCTEHGKTARTRWRVRERRGNRTLVDLWPVTGRTHQLRVHCAHPLGLGCPIVGDDLYGAPADRLHLHAAWISFVHPETKERVEFQSPCPFA
ncbi:RluA family pseudouridine synthase [Lewinella sp. IMCC34183]|uniref:RluA family pseudouridine synthase n=1 Tax=Lewinella sp. IMCC34183 TaxID=2248762 RepID=UPI0018E5A00F|nr:RluA family pseudouridine synthase [Lewinella sp. IMCC34183]